MAVAVRLTTRAWSPPAARAADEALDAVERQRSKNYPLSRWYLRPAAQTAARRLSDTSLRPGHVTALGLAMAAGAAALLLAGPTAWQWSAALVLGYWFCDRLDGLLARQQGTASAAGAWFDANADELVDLGLHAALAGALALHRQSTLAVWLLVGFAIGKYLLMYGLNGEEAFGAEGQPENRPRGDASASAPAVRSWLHRLYHLPANADVRVHLLALALCTGWVTAELALLAVYYNLRWLIRLWLVPARLQRGPS